MKQVIIIEDEKSIAELVELHLEDMNCRCTIFSNGRKGFEYAISHPFDLMILDLSLPEMNGTDICKGIRAKGISSPIVMLTARSEELDKVLGLEIGADDYITKPFSIRELLARVRVIFRRQDADKQSEPENKKVIRSKDLTIDRESRIVTRNGKRIELTPREFDLLYLLASHPGVTYDRKTLLNQIWGLEYNGYEHTVNSHMNRLRMKVEEDANNPQYVLTTWGVGYRFADERD